MALFLVPRALQYVEAVAEHGSIQAASRETGIAASAIDRQIKLIEDHVGSQLFDRRPTGMSLTSVGEMFVLLARRWRTEERRLWSDVKQMQGVDLGHIRLVTMDSLVNGLVPLFLIRMAKTYPRVRVDVDVATPDEAVIALSDNQADLALVFNLRPPRDIHVLWRSDLPLYCVVSPDHPLAGQACVSLQTVRQHAIVVQSRALTIRRILEARHSWMFSEERPPIVTNSLQLLKQLVAAGGHVALTSEMDTAPELLDGRLVAIPIAGTTVSPQSISLAVNARQVLPRITTIVADIIAEEAATMQAAVRAKTGLTRLTRAPVGSPATAPTLDLSDVN